MSQQSHILPFQQPCSSAWISETTRTVPCGKTWRTSKNFFPPTRRTAVRPLFDFGRYIMELFWLKQKQNKKTNRIGQSRNWQVNFSKDRWVVRKLESVHHYWFVVVTNGFQFAMGFVSVKYTKVCSSNAEEKDKKKRSEATGILLQASLYEKESQKQFSQ